MRLSINLEPTEQFRGHWRSRTNSHLAGDDRQGGLAYRLHNYLEQGFKVGSPDATAQLGKLKQTGSVAKSKAVVTVVPIESAEPLGLWCWLWPTVVRNAHSADRPPMGHQGLWTARYPHSLVLGYAASLVEADMKQNKIVKDRCIPAYLRAFLDLAPCSAYWHSWDLLQPWPRFDVGSVLSLLVWYR